MRIRITPEAEAEFAEGGWWYDRKRDGLGEEFVAEVNEALFRIADNPGLFGPYEGGRTKRRYQRALVNRFPYVIIFEVISDEVVVYSIGSGSRKPGYWECR